jgi:hypothetical protein
MCDYSLLYGVRPVKWGVEPVIRYSVVCVCWVCLFELMRMEW